MSWQGYIDRIMETKVFTCCGIFGLDGSVWASTENFPIIPEDIKKAIEYISNDGKVKQEGIRVGSEKYVFIRSDSGVSLVLKSGKKGLIIQKSVQCVIIGIHGEKNTTETAFNQIARVIEYLSKNGF